MAEVAGPALSFAVEKLGNLLIQKVNLLQGVEEGVTWLKRELEMMQSFLKDAAKKQVNDERVRAWISNVRDLALDAEDAIESFALKVDAPRSRQGPVRRCVRFPQRVNHLNELGKAIESIRKRLDVIKSRLTTYGIQHLDTEPGPSKKRAAVERQRQVLPWHTNKHVVGIDGDVKVLLQRAIFVDKDGLSIASIVGMGGSGKSTLAKEVYNKAKDQFECHVWITVSQDFRPKKVMKEMLEQLMGNNDDKMKEAASKDKLMEMVNQCLKGKRYLVVVDDVWDSSDWNYLAKVFPDDQDKSSRLLITSRNRKIISTRDLYIHDMRALDPDTSWQLFLKASLHDANDGKCLPKLEGIGKQILGKCNGLPLAIVVAGGLLFEQEQTVRAWESIRTRITSHALAQNDSVQAVLELSYEDLPPHLRTCFLCLSFFREDYSIYAEELIYTWIAEGIVTEEEGQTMEQTAWSFLTELINRNMVEANKFHADGQVSHYKIHDLFLDLSIAKAEEEIKFEIVRGGNSYRDPLKMRHLSIYCDSEKFTSLQCPNPHVRTLFFHNLDNRNSGENVSCTFNHWKSLKGLRVLYLWDAGLQEVSKTIGTMIGLRYLNLARNKIRKLPKSLGHLRKLQTLNIMACEEVEVPDVLWKLDKLRHLMMPMNITRKKPLKLDTLKNLQTLVTVSSNNIVVEQLKELINLRELDLFLASDTDARKFITSLGTLKNLCKLYLEWNHGQVSLDGFENFQHLNVLSVVGPLEKLPNVLPNSVLDLELIGTELRDDPMVVLEVLPELLSLGLSGNAYIHEEMTIRNNGFPKLRCLSLEDMPDLKLLHSGSNAMPKLIKLVTKRCPKMEILPREEELRLIANIQELHISGTREETATKFKSDDYSHVISNIPDVKISVRNK